MLFTKFDSSVIIFNISKEKPRCGGFIEKE